ncbi:MAG: hypothetical protein IJV22_00030 [Bacteroidales bacterium]|nr:hypothetical protein [Bacteroidales bacterium]
MLFQSVEPSTAADGVATKVRTFRHMQPTDEIGTAVGGNDGEEMRR